MAATSVAAAVLLTAMKLVAGLATGSLGILSEALHSGLDLVAAVVTLFAVHASARPADSGHHFGHGKVENLSALFETGLLLLTCGWIVYEAMKRLTGGGVEIEATTLAFGVMAVSIAVDVSRSRALSRVARRTGSQALEADALHFSTDVWSSSVVIGGLIAVRLAPVLDAPWLMHADAVAALGVAGIVVWVSLRLGRRTVADLLDETPPELRARVEEAAHVNGVIGVERVRVRRAGSEHFVDLTLKADSELSLEGAHLLADRVEESVCARLPGADVVVHVEPAPDASAARPTTPEIRALARAEGLAVHAAHVSCGPDGLVLEIHVEVDPDLDVAQAHQRAAGLERRLRQRFSAIERIAMHIEPRGDVAGRAPVTRAGIAEEARRVAEERGLVCDVRDVALLGVEAGLAVTFLCAMAPDVGIAEAHSLTAAMEAAIHDRFPGVDRITIHIGPLGDV